MFKWLGKCTMVAILFYNFIINNGTFLSKLFPCFVRVISVSCGVIENNQAVKF